MKKIIFIFTFLSSVLFSQVREIDELNTIYYNLEYNTIAYDDLKEKWILTDPLLVRDTFNRFLVKNKLSKNQLGLNRSELLELSKNLDALDVIVLLTRRYYDDEIEQLVFIPYDDLKARSLDRSVVDPIEGWFFIRDVVGTALYQKIKDQSYFYSDLSQKKFYEREGYYFDVYLNAIKPRLLLWSNTTEESDKYLFSLEGEWGQAKLFNSGWFSNMYFIGGSIKYYGAVSNNPDEYSYKISVMGDFETKFPYQHHANKMYKRYNHLALSFDTRISTKQNSFYNKTFVSAYAGAAIAKEPGQRLNQYNSNDDVFAIEHSLAIDIKQKDLFPLGDFGKFGFGVAANVYNIEKRRQNAVNPKIFNWISSSMQAEFGPIFSIRKYGKLISYDFDLTLLYDFNEGSTFGGATFNFMFSNTFGIYIQYMAYIKEPQIYPWRQNNMIVLSPIIRINY